MSVLPFATHVGALIVSSRNIHVCIQNIRNNSFYSILLAVYVLSSLAYFFLSVRDSERKKVPTLRIFFVFCNFRGQQDNIFLKFLWGLFFKKLKSDETFSFHSLILKGGLTKKKKFSENYLNTFYNDRRIYDNYV